MQEQVRRSYRIAVLLFSLIWSVSAYAAGIEVKVSQVDMSDYPRVVLYASVTDERGQPVDDLTRDDFQVTEDGVPVALTDFAGTGSVRMVDIVFVFDTTTSMRTEVNGMKQTSLAFAEKLERSGLDYRLGLVDFGDVIKRVERPDGQLTDDAQEFKGWISGIRLAGGGVNIPELTLGALQRATEMSFRDGVMKIAILITDAPPHHYGDYPDGGVRFDDPTLTLEHTVLRLAEANMTTYIIAPRHSDYTEIVEETGGQFFEIHGRSDFTTIIDQIGGLIAAQYRLAYTSPRPTYDGTRRNVEVSVGEARGTTTYLERHLVDIRSSGLVALFLFFPLLFALALPAAVRPYRASRPQPVASTQHSPVQPGAWVAQGTCPSCGQPMRPEAKFCLHCGAGAMQHGQPEPTPCPYCRQPMRPGARFCSVCGRPTAQG